MKESILQKADHPQCMVPISHRILFAYSKGGSSVPPLFTIFKVRLNLNRILFSLRGTILEYSARVFKVTVVL